VELTLWNRVVPNDHLEVEVNHLLQVLRSKNQQGVRQLKFIINKGVECDLYTAQGFEALSAALTGAVSGMWEIEDADKGAGVMGFTDKDSLWQTRRRLARDFWVDI
jgi:enoyl-CoA hydratase